MPVSVRVGVARILKVIVWRQTNANAVSADSRGGLFQDLKDNARPVLNRATIVVGAFVDIVVKELVEKVSVCA